MRTQLLEKEQEQLLAERHLEEAKEHQAGLETRLLEASEAQEALEQEGTFATERLRDLRQRSLAIDATLQKAGETRSELEKRQTELERETRKAAEARRQKEVEKKRKAGYESCFFCRTIAVPDLSRKAAEGQYAQCQGAHQNLGPDIPAYLNLPDQITGWLRRAGGRSAADCGRLAVGPGTPYAKSLGAAGVGVTLVITRGVP